MKKNILNIVFLSTFFAALALSGCQKQTRYNVFTAPPIFSVQTVGYSVEHRPIELYTAGHGEQTIFIFAGIHGNEQAGIGLTHRLMERIQQRPKLLEGRTILIIPNTNPDGVVKNIRGNANHIDLNRNFPAENRINSYPYGYDALSEPESKILYDLINQQRPTRIISLHQPLVCIDHDGPGEELAHFMSSYCPLPVKKLGARPGSFGAYAGETLGIPIITLELERSDDDLTIDQLWQKYGVCMIASITYPELPY